MPQIVELNPDEQLFESARQGDSRAYETLFRKYYEPLVWYAMKTLPDQAKAEGGVQEVFIKLWEKRDELSFSTSVKSYLYRAVHNHMLNAIKHEKVKEAHRNYVKHDFNEGATDHAVEESELEVRLNRALELLPDRCREVFELSRFAGKKYAEIADELEISVKTVENQMGKALKILRVELKDCLPLLLFLLGSGWG